jgi:hypothetical protein
VSLQVGHQALKRADSNHTAGGAGGLVCGVISQGDRRLIIFAVIRFPDTVRYSRRLNRR